jgi:hypothetical protein
MNRVKQPVPLAECKRRCLSFMYEHGYGQNSGRFMKASEAAHAIWPDTVFKSQGAGASVSRILVALERDGFVKWDRDGDQWGWVLRVYGRPVV